MGLVTENRPDTIAAVATGGVVSAIGILRLSGSRAVTIMDEVFRPEDGEVKEFPLLFDYKENSRGVGLADAAVSIRTGRAPRTSWKQTFHVLDAMTGFQRSADSGQWVKMQTEYTREAPMKKMPLPGELD